MKRRGKLIDRPFPKTNLPSTKLLSETNCFQAEIKNNVAGRYCYQARPFYERETNQRISGKFEEKGYIYLFAVLFICFVFVFDIQSSVRPFLLPFFPLILRSQSNKAFSNTWTKRQMSKTIKFVQLLYLQK